MQQLQIERSTCIKWNKLFHKALAFHIYHSQLLVLNAIFAPFCIPPFILLSLAIFGMRQIQGCSNKKINMVTAFVLWQFNTSVRQLHKHCVYTNPDFTGCSEFWKVSPKRACQVCSSSSAHYRLYFNLFIAGIPAPLFRRQIQLQSTVPGIQLTLYLLHVAL